MDVAKILDWLKSSPKYLFSIALVSGFGLFSPPFVLDIFGLTFFVTQYRPYFGIAFLISVATVLTEAILVVHRTVSARRLKSRVVKQQLQALHNLTGQEKLILLSYLNRKTKTAYLDPEDGVVCGLEAQGIIHRATAIGGMARSAYNIQPWAWDYIIDNPHLIA